MQQKPRVSATALDFGDLSIPLRIRRHRRARRILLTVDAVGRGGVLTLPPSARLPAGLDFVAEKALWLRRRLDALPTPVELCDGAALPIQGEPHRISHRPDLLGGVWREAGLLIVTGRAEHLKRRIGDWLRRLAHETLEARSRTMAIAIGKPPPRIFIRDTRTRWGSCASDGRIHFSWRLILAPDFVLDYVAAHEVAHLAYRGHGPRFWSLVERLTPHRHGAEPWLRRHGTSLLLVGATNG